MYLPTDEQFWSKNDKTKPDIAFLKNHFYREGRLTEEQALYILQKWVLFCPADSMHACMAHAAVLSRPLSEPRLTPQGR
jgi:serine/threonine-protein phosphatase 2B catalytic subunit